MGGKKLVQLDAKQEINLLQDDEEGCWSGKGGYLRPGGMTKEEFEAKKKCKDPCESVKRKEKEAEEADKKAKQMEVIAHKEAATDIIKKQQEAEEKANADAIENDKELKKANDEIKAKKAKAEAADAEGSPAPVSE